MSGRAATKRRTSSQVATPTVWPDLAAGPIAESPEDRAAGPAPRAGRRRFRPNALGPFVLPPPVVPRIGLVPADTAGMTCGPAVVPLRFGLGLAVVATFLLTMSIGDTGPWLDGVTTVGRVVYVQDRWSSKGGGSARVAYEVDGARFERWLPGFSEQGQVKVGDSYLLEYRTGDPTRARGVAANRDDARFEPIARGSGLAAAILAVAAVVTHFMWRQRPDDSTNGPAPQRAR